jgi:hypothetical protein
VVLEFIQGGYAMEKLNPKITAKKAATSSAAMAGGMGMVTLTYYVLKWMFKIEIPTDFLVAAFTAAPVAVAGIGRAIENLIRFYVKMKKIAKEEK